MSKLTDHDIYIIPPNFIESGTFFGGMFKIRNAIEAGVLAISAGIPVFKLGLPLTTRIIIFCLTGLPLALLALIGISGDSLSSFIIAFVKYLKHRRIVGGAVTEKATDSRPIKEKCKPSAVPKQRKSKNIDFAEEFGDKRVKTQRISRVTTEKSKPSHPVSEPVAKRFISQTAQYMPVEKIDNGIIYTKDKRYIKIIEVVPINFLLRSAREQRSIIYSFISYLKISPVKLQFKVLTKRADINRHLATVSRELENEKDERCRLLQEDYAALIRQIGSKEAITRRFFIIFEYESWNGHRRGNDETDAIAALNNAARTAVNYLKQCGNEVITSENDNEFTIDVLYNLLNRKTSAEIPLPEHIKGVVSKYQGLTSSETIPVCEFFAPESIDFMHGRHIKIDGVYHSYLLIPSGGFKSQVTAGWLSLLVNAGEGVDLDIFLARQPKERIVQKLGQ